MFAVQIPDENSTVLAHLLNRVYKLEAEDELTNVVQNAPTMIPIYAQFYRGIVDRMSVLEEQLEQSKAEAERLKQEMAAQLAAEKKRIADERARQVKLAEEKRQAEEKAIAEAAKRKASLAEDSGELTQVLPLIGIGLILSQLVTV